MSLFKADIIPLVTLKPTPKGFPSAKTTSPSIKSSEFVKVIAERLLASIFITAKSVFGSLPISFALYSMSLPGNSL